MREPGVVVLQEGFYVTCIKPWPNPPDLVEKGQNPLEGEFSLGGKLDRDGRIEFIRDNYESVLSHRPRPRVCFQTQGLNRKRRAWPQVEGDFDSFRAEDPIGPYLEDVPIRPFVDDASRSNSKNKESVLY